MTFAEQNGQKVVRWIDLDDTADSRNSNSLCEEKAMATRGTQRDTKPPKQATTPGRRARAESTSAEAEREGHGPALPPTGEEIAARAYEIFLARDRQHGNDRADWLQAETELTRERNERGVPKQALSRAVSGVPRLGAANGSGGR